MKEDFLPASVGSMGVVFHNNISEKREETTYIRDVQTYIRDVFLFALCPLFFFLLRSYAVMELRPNRQCPRSH